MAEDGEREYLTPTRTELVWPGKHTQVERVALPFQVVETVNQSRATREQTPILAGLPPPPLFEGQTTAATSWKNKLIWGENKYVMASLLQGDPSVGLEPLAGKIDLIYIDPPFDTGDNFSINMRVGDEELLKKPSIIEETAYRDTWGTWPKLDSYLQVMYDRLVLMKDLLSDNGSIYVHMDWHVGHYVKLIMDEIFGKENFLNEVVWEYQGAWSETKMYFPRRHNVIYLYSKTDHHYFERDYEDDTNTGINFNRWYSYIQNNKIYARNAPYHDQRFAIYVEKFAKEYGREPTGNDVLIDFKGSVVGSVWYIKVVDPKSPENMGYSTQKPMKLLERILDSSCPERGLVADFFCGSGTTSAVAEKLGRRWIGCDLSRFAIQVSRKRLLDIPDCQPFHVLNLGKYERHYWQMKVLNGEQADGSRAIADYLRFIVALYHAEPAEGCAYLHGQKAGRWVHVGATDAAVTRAEVMGAVHECQANRYTALDVLGWEWEMGLHDTVRDEARRLGVDLRLLYIPREVMDKRAVEAGDVHFYELAYLKTSLLQDSLMVTVRLDDFIIPNPDLVPDDVRSKVKKWSDYIDFWAVDWNYAEDTFHNEWQTYRTRKSPALRLISDPHTYPEPGKYRVLIKVIDILGNDTTQLLQVAVP